MDNEYILFKEQIEEEKKREITYHMVVLQKKTYHMVLRQLILRVN